MVVSTGQGTPDTTQQGGDESHLNPEGGNLQAAPPRGLGSPDTSETSGDPRRTPRRGIDLSGSVGNTYSTGGRSIGDKRRASEGVAKGGYMGKGTRTMMVG